MKDPMQGIQYNTKNVIMAAPRMRDRVQYEELWSREEIDAYPVRKAAENYLKSFKLVDRLCC